MKISFIFVSVAEIFFMAPVSLLGHSRMIAYVP